MPLAAVVPIAVRARGEFVLVQLALPGGPVHDVGVLLVDADADSRRHALRLRAHWDDLAGAEDAEYLSALARDFEDKIAEMGARRLLESWEDSLSHVLRVSERDGVAVDSFSRVADRIFEGGSKEYRWSGFVRICRCTLCARRRESSAPTKKWRKKIGCGLRRACA